MPLLKFIHLEQLVSIVGQNMGWANSEEICLCKTITNHAVSWLYLILTVLKNSPNYHNNMHIIIEYIIYKAKYEW